MPWLLGLVPVAFGTVTWLATADTSSSLVSAIVAFGVITGLSGAIAKLWSENQRLQKRLEDSADVAMNKLLPALGEAIAEMRETRRERVRVGKILDKFDPPTRRGRRPTT